jgi:hypothetical protein
MRTRFLFIILLIVGVSAFLLWALRPKGPRETVVDTKVVEMGDSDRVQIDSKMETGSVTALPSPIQTTGNTTAISNVSTQVGSAQVSNMVHEIQRTVNAPIEFYGKVVDEKSNPLAAVTVELGCTIYPEEYITTNVFTDGNGMFELRGAMGAKLDVRVMKAGYTVDKQMTPRRSFTYTHLPAYDGERFVPDFRQPVIFHLQPK